jgi:hypothetical protein
LKDRSTGRRWRPRRVLFRAGYREFARVGPTASDDDGDQQLPPSTATSRQRPRDDPDMEAGPSRRTSIGSPGRSDDSDSDDGNEGESGPLTVGAAAAAKRKRRERACRSRLL